MGVGFVSTTEGATQTDLVGEQHNNGRVVAKIDVSIKQNLGYGNYKVGQHD
jgi:hypothetical protein